MTAAIYPGSFDPVTNGHLDVIARGARLFDRLIVAVANNTSKQPWFDAGERVALLREAVAGIAGGERVTVESFDGMIVEFARQRGITCLLRGLRSVSDFDFELQMAQTNRTFAPEIETVFVMPSVEFAFVASRLIRESVKLGADVSHLVPAFVQQRMREKLAAGGPRGAK
jgi:pantetheine-phosphate adenylyltransferase